MTKQLTVLVTGSDGFVGRHLVSFLVSRGYSIIAAARTASAIEHPNIIVTPIPDLSKSFDWQPLLEKCDSIVHLAGIAHRFADDDHYKRVNYLATKALAEAASTRKKHLVFVSSIAAQSGSFASRELTEDDPPEPTNAYGRSKLAAEQSVRAAGGNFTILRPVVIYGEGEKGNFATIHRISGLPLPLPFGAVTALRSVLSVENFNSAVITVLNNPGARGETFIVSDPKPLTVSDLIARRRAGMGRPRWLIPIPESWIERLLITIGQGESWDRIGRPLVARPTKLLALGWNPT